MRGSRLTAVMLCGVVGALGGALTLVVGQTSLVTGVLHGGLYGVLFALLVARRAVSPGAGLVWGLGYAFLLWVAVPVGMLPVMRGGTPALGLLEAARAQFPALVASVLGVGLLLGVALGLWGSRQPVGPENRSQL